MICSGPMNDGNRSMPDNMHNAGVTTSDVENTPSPQPYIHSSEPNKKDDMKMVPTVVPLMSYAPAPTAYQPIEESVPIYSGAQPQPAAFQTTYQQGVCHILFIY